jgi:hypothetical protein
MKRLKVEGGKERPYITFREGLGRLVGISKW